MKPASGALAAALLSTLASAAVSTPPPSGPLPYRRGDLVPVTCLNRTLYVPFPPSIPHVLTRR
jgi:hypothetical protein